MAGAGSILFVSDNSGLKCVRCIKVPRVTKKNKYENGEYVVVAINKGHLKKKFSNKKIALGLVITRKGPIRRRPGYFVYFGQSRVVLFAHKEKTIGTRLYGPISAEARRVNTTKIIKFAKKIL
jgi:large subunit ribosomal protein L14